MTKENEIKKRYLLQYLAALNDEIRLGDELDTVYASAYPSGISYDGVGGGSSVPHGLESVMAKVDSMAGELRAAMDARWELRQEIMRSIEGLHRDGARPEEIDLEKRVLTQYYIMPKAKMTMGRVTAYQQKTMEEVAASLGYSKDWVAHVHGVALADLDIPKHPDM